MVYEVVKRVGSFTESICDVTPFDDRAEAEAWAAEFLTAHPEMFRKGLESIGVRPRHRASA